MKTDENNDQKEAHLYFVCSNYSGFRFFFTFLSGCLDAQFNVI